MRLERVAMGPLVEHESVVRDWGTPWGDYVQPEHSAGCVEPIFVLMASTAERDCVRLA